jgi:hypothetical protein
LAPKPHGGAHRLPSTRRSLLAMGATGLLAGGAAVAISDIAGRTEASAAVTPIRDTGSPDWVNVTSYGADPTGAKDSTAAFNSAIKALGDPLAGASPVTTTGAGWTTTTTGPSSSTAASTRATARATSSSTGPAPPPPPAAAASSGATWTSTSTRTRAGSTGWCSGTAPSSPTAR